MISQSLGCGIIYRSGQRKSPDTRFSDVSGLFLLV